MKPETLQPEISTTETLYQERLNRYLTAMRNEKPDCVPIRPFVAEFTAKFTGMTCQDVVHDYNRAFEAVRKTAAAFDWDAVVSNMVYVWTGLTQAMGLKYYGIPGIDVPPIHGFQYREPDEEHSFMKRCKKVLDGVAREGGYIMDASAIIQNDASVENLRVLTDFTREYGIYSETGIQENSNAEMKKKEWSNEKILNGSPSCISWEEKLKEIPSISGDPDLFRKVWEEIDAFGHMFIWQCLLSF